MFEPQPKPIKTETKNVSKPKKLGSRKCANCGDRFAKSQPLQQTCSIHCAIEYSRKLEAKRANKIARADKKEKLDKLKSVADWKKDLQVVVNWIVRELDKDFPCISHPETKNFLRYDAGHAYTVKVHSDVRYNVHNIHKQSSEANERHGFCAEYAKGLKVRYGQKYLDMVLSLPLDWKGIGKDKFTISNIKDIYLPNARRIQREMKDGAEFSRDQVNEMIGIYVRD